MIQLTLLALPMPSLMMMFMLWINCAFLDNLPSNAIAERRHYLRLALLCLTMTIVFMGSTIYNLPNLLESVQEFEKMGK